MKKLRNLVITTILAIVIGLISTSSAFAQEVVPQVTVQESAAVVSTDGSASSSVSRGGEARSARPHAGQVPETDEIEVKVFASVGPPKGDPDFYEFSTSFLTGAMNGSLASGSPTATTFYMLQRKFSPEYIIAPTKGSGVNMWLGKVGGVRNIGSTIWFAVVATAKEGRTFFPTNFFGQITSGPNEFLSSLEWFNNPDFVYGDTSRGMYRDSVGTTKYLTGGRWSENGVEKFVFIGMAVSTMDANTQTVSDANRDWMNNRYPNSTLEGTWRFVSGGKTYTGTKVLETNPYVDPLPITPPTLKVERLADGKVRVSAPDLVGSGNLERRSSLASGGWEVVGVLNNSTPLELFSSSAEEYYRFVAP